MTIRDRYRPGLAAVVKAPIWGYRLTLSFFIGHGCRFQPTCSAYALEAIDVHGPMGGLCLAARRLARCHPWGGSGFDPVPEEPARAARRYGQ